MDGYDVLAHEYDKMITDVDYDTWAEKITKVLKNSGIDETSYIIDLGCGTGNMSFALAQRGYDVTGVDLSPEMLTVASSKLVGNLHRGMVNFVENDMTEYISDFPADAVVCCLDGINHLIYEDEITSAFDCVNHSLRPGGAFIFDLNTPHKFFTKYNNNDYFYETDDAVCMWRNRFYEDEEVCDFHLSVFQKNPDGSYRRSDGITSEKSYGKESIEFMLRKSGFTDISFYSDLSGVPASDADDRWYVVCYKEQ